MIYVLLLQENKFYVGYSERPIGERFIEHFNYRGSKWTTLYRPVQVLQVQPGGIEEENEMTLRMMDKYGWWNVRGGYWCQVDMQSCPQALLEWQNLKLPPTLRQNQPSLTKSNRRTNNCCSRCGRDSHSVRDCFARTNVNGQALDSFDSESDSSESDQGACYRCGRSTHFAKDCYARTHINGSFL
jgi:ribosomal protein L37E